MKKTFSKVLALTLTVVISLIAFSACVQTQTTGITKEYFEKNKAAVLAKSIDYSDLFLGTENPFRVFEKGIGSISIDFTEPESGLEISADVNMDVSKAKNSIDLALGVAGQTIDIGAYFDKQKFALYSDMLLGEGKAYGITYDSFDNIVAKFDKSAIASLLGLEEGMAEQVCELYGINQQYIDAVAKACKEYADMVSAINYAQLSEKTYAACEPFYKGVTEETVEINGKQIEALALELDCSKEMFIATYDVAFDFYEDMLAQTKDLYAAFIPEPFKEEMVPAFFNEFDMAMEAVKDEYETMFEDFETSGNVKVYIAKETGLLVKETVLLDMTYDGETVHIDVNEYVDEDITFDGTMSVGAETVDLSGKMGYTGDDTKNKWALVMDLFNEEFENIFVDMGFEINKADGTFNLYMNADEAEEETARMAIDGKIAYTEDSLEITTENITVSEYGYQEKMPFNLGLGFSTKAQVTEPGEYADILELAEDEVYALVGKITMSVNSLLPLFEQPEPDFYDEYYYDDYYYDDYYEYDFDDYYEYYDEY